MLCGRVGSNARALLYGLDVCAAPLLFKGVGCCRLHLWCELHLSYLKESGVAVHKFLQMRSQVEDVYILVEMKSVFITEVMVDQGKLFILHFKKLMIVIWREICFGSLFQSIAVLG